MYCAKIIASLGLLLDIIGVYVLFYSEYKKIDKNMADELLGGRPTEEKMAEKRYSRKGNTLVL